MVTSSQVATFSQPGGHWEYDREPLTQLSGHLSDRRVRNGLHDLSLAHGVLRAVHNLVETRGELEQIFGLERRAEGDAERLAELTRAGIRAMLASPARSGR
jgi:hypothetical protein